MTQNEETTPMTLKVRIETGDRVRSNDGYDPTPHEGTVHSIALGYTRQGIAPIVRVMVDKKDGQSVEPHLHESAAVLWDKVLDDGSTKPSEPPKSESAKCPSCGEAHNDGPFTPEMVDLFHKLKDASPDDQEVILIEMAERFCEAYSTTDRSMPEWLHKKMIKTANAQMKAHQAMLRVGRLVAHNIDQIEKQRAVQGHIRQVMVLPLVAPGEKKGDKGGGLN